MKTSEIALTIVFTSLYAVLVIVLGVAGQGPVQLRLADCLIPLAALFGWPVIVGVTAGCFVANSVAFLGVEDVIFGTLANLIAATIVYLLRNRQFLACTIGALPIGAIVGSYLWLFFEFQIDIFGLQVPAAATMTISITMSTLIVMSIIGYALLKTLSRPNFVQMFKSWGLKVYTKE
ncbi:MAG: QueT transporter family protein [Candidatus Bathyarchaeota archaeon]|nr:QueT transporter family protein [Candidatus Bathyarchaeota archaeon]